jgi:hypothetical protein
MFLAPMAAIQKASLYLKEKTIFTIYQGLIKSSCVPLVDYKELLQDQHQNQLAFIIRRTMVHTRIYHLNLLSQKELRGSSLIF